MQAEKILEDFYRVSGTYEYLTVEGSGGIVCPIRADEKEFMLTDFIKAFNLSILIVSSAKLGDINNCVLTVEYAKSCGINIKGIILNRFNAGNLLEEDNKKMIEYLTKVPVVACVEDNAQDIELADITSLYEESSILWN
ncbi:dethiobiotin synthase [Selenomonadales bacterium OttesenSCG-928-I06]|nr:dethiobiotin synthase [Selenomonadales bacterium OttesenSCG-928-I06]